jgi:hypothetical protein
VRRLSDEAGSAILEFITFVLVGQLLVFAASMSLSSALTNKVELQILASQAARTIALGRDFQVSSEVRLSKQDCGIHIVCLSLEKGELRVSAVNYR